MATINIAGLTPVDDPSYRYKMPRIVAKVEGRGNGIKTVLMNIVDLGLSLNREAPEITKFFGCELGSQTSYAADTDRAIVNGAHTPQTLQTHLSKYIENYVLCAQCKLPETHYKIKSGIISQKCLACGHKGVVDMTHKLTTFILAQHKKAKETAGGKKEKDKKDKKRGEDSASPPLDADEGAVKVTKPKKERKQNDLSLLGEPLDDEAVGSVTAYGDGDDAVANGAGNTEDVDAESDRAAVDTCVTRFSSWLAQNPDKLSKMTDALEELRMVQTFASLHVRYRPVILLGAMFNESTIINDITRYKDFLIALTSQSTGSQRQLIAAFEWLFAARFPSKVAIFPIALKVLYEEELVEEEVFLAWSGDLTRNEYSVDQSMLSLEALEGLRESAKPFITWLQEAEEEDDGEDDGNDEEEGDGVDSKDDEDEEIDIDNI